MLSVVGVVRYNGFTFVNPMHPSQLSINPVYDEAGRTVIYNEYELFIRAYIVDPDAPGSASTVEEMEAIRPYLTQPGRPLTFTTKGTGDIEVTGATYSVQDVRWGPKPTSLIWMPVGRESAALVEWRCSFCMAECNTAPEAGKKGILAANYEVRYSIGDEGLTTRTVTGYLMVPATRWNQSSDGVDLVIHNHADKFREDIAPEIPNGFRRTSQDFTLSKDKARLDFSIVDTEMDYPLPHGTVKCDIEESVDWKRSKAGNFYLTISGSITVAPGQPKSSAYDKFALICADQIDFVKAGFPGAKAAAFVGGAGAARAAGAAASRPTLGQALGGAAFGGFSA